MFRFLNDRRLPRWHNFSYRWHTTKWAKKTRPKRRVAEARALIDAELENWKGETPRFGDTDWLRSMSVLREAEARFRAGMSANPVPFPALPPSRPPAFVLPLGKHMCHA